MKKLLSAVIGAVALGASGAQAALVSIETDAEVVGLGETFDVAFTFEAESQFEFLTAFVVDLFYSPETVDVVGASFVDPATGQNQLSFAGADPALEDFTFDAFGGLGTLFGVSGNTDGTILDNQEASFTYAVLTFEASALGTADIGYDLFLDYFGLFGDLLTAEVANGFVSVEVVPLPGALVFMASGLAGLAARRRRLA